MAIIAWLVGTLVLVGWAANIGVLKSVHPLMPTMKPNTAVALIAIGMAIFFLPASRGWAYWLSRSAAALAALIGLLTLVQYLIHLDLRIDHLLFPEPPGAIGTTYAGRPPVLACIVLLLLGSALLLHDVVTRRGYRPAEFLAFGAALGASVGVLDFLISPFVSDTGVAVHGIAAFCLCSIAVLFARPDRGHMALVTSDSRAGAAARRLLIAAIFVPIVAGWLVWQGQHLGFYGTWFRLADFMVITIVLLVGLTIWTARAMHRAELEQRKAHESLRESEERFRLLLDSVKDYAIFMLDTSGRVSSWNAGAERMLGWPASEIIGQPLSRFFRARTSPPACTSASWRPLPATAATRPRPGAGAATARSSGSTASPAPSAMRAASS